MNPDFRRDEAQRKADPKPGAEKFISAKCVSIQTTFLRHTVLTLPDTICEHINQVGPLLSVNAPSRTLKISGANGFCGGEPRRGEMFIDAGE